MLDLKANILFLQARKQAFFIKLAAVLFQVVPLFRKTHVILICGRISIETLFSGQGE